MRFFKRKPKLRERLGSLSAELMNLSDCPYHEVIKSRKCKITDDLVAWTIAKNCERKLHISEAFDKSSELFKDNSPERISLSRISLILKKQGYMNEMVNRLIQENFPDLSVYSIAMNNLHMTLTVSQFYLGFVTWSAEYEHIHRLIKFKITLRDKLDID